MAKIHRAYVTDREGCSGPQWVPLSHLWLDAGYTGQEDRGAGWVERTLGRTAEIVRHPPKPTPEPR